MAHHQRLEPPDPHGTAGPAHHGRTRARLRVRRAPCRGVVIVHSAAVPVDRATRLPSRHHPLRARRCTGWGTGPLRRSVRGKARPAVCRPQPGRAAVPPLRPTAPTHLLRVARDRLLQVLPDQGPTAACRDCCVSRPNRSTRTMAPTGRPAAAHADADAGPTIYWPLDHPSPTTATRLSRDPGPPACVTRRILCK
jgi:hypothetical protein